MLEITNKFTKPIFEFAKSQMKPETMKTMKESILRDIDKQLNKYREILSIRTDDNQESKETRKIIIKYEYLKSFTEWSMGKIDRERFKYYHFT